MISCSRSAWLTAVLIYRETAFMMCADPLQCFCPAML